MNFHKSFAGLRRNAKPKTSLFKVIYDFIPPDKTLWLGSNRNLEPFFWEGQEICLEWPIVRNDNLPSQSCNPKSRVRAFN